MERRIFLYIGISILAMLIFSFFIDLKITVQNQLTHTPLLGIIIFYSPFVLILYILIALAFIFLGITKKKIKFI